MRASSDTLNYLDGDDDLLAALQGFRRNLAPEGLAVWDVNTLAMYRGEFSRTWAIEDGDGLVLWRGCAGAEFERGDRAQVTIDLFAPGASGWSRTTSVHRQRHWPVEDVSATARAAGLRVLSVRGQHHGARPDVELDEAEHPKALFIACRDDRIGEGVSANAHRQPVRP